MRFLILTHIFLFFSGATLAGSKPDMLLKTKDPLFSYGLVEERAEYFAFKIKQLTFGEYTEQVLFISPLITGNLEFHAMDMKFYYNYNNIVNNIFNFTMTHLRIDSLLMGVLVAYFYHFKLELIKSFTEKYNYLLLLFIFLALSFKLPSSS